MLKSKITNGIEKSPSQVNKFRYNSRTHYSTIREKIKKELCLPKLSKIVNENEFTPEEA